MELRLEMTTDLVHILERMMNLFITGYHRARHYKLLKVLVNSMKNRSHV